MRAVRLLLTVAVAGGVLVGLPGTAAATPVADSDSEYASCGRVFPDPLAYKPSPMAAPGESPWAKGNVQCRAVDFIQFGEAVSGLEYLEQRYPRFVEVYNLREDFADVLADVQGGGQSAGLAKPDLTRDKSDLYMVRITDEQVPADDKKRFLFTLSLHGIEKAGLEGGLRAAEDLATWGAESPDQPIMETLPESLPVGQALRQSEVWFAMNNPDGWRRGDTTNGGLAYQRYNGNGVDLNRDWPEKGYTYRPYTPGSEPETASFMKVWKDISPTWAGGVDLHGQLIDRAFSFTLLGASQRPYGKNQRMLQFTQGAYQDAETRLAWNPLIKPNDAPKACVEPGLGGGTNPEPGCDPTPRVYGVQYGSIWDTIAYTVTGAIGDWADSDLGLDADFIDNEMSLSHLSNCYTGKCYIQSAEQLHVDGNKSLIYAMINYTLLPEDQTFRFTGEAAYLTQPERLQHAGSAAPAPPSGLPVQDPITGQRIAKPTTSDATYEFDVKGPSEGVSSGGLSAKVTFSNVQGISPDALLTVAIDRFSAEEPEPGGSQWTPVNQDFNQSPIYLQAGMQVDANDLLPGRYRLRLSGPTPALASADITFTSGRAWPDPGQLPYDVSNLDFFSELAPFAGQGKLTPVPASDVAAGRDLSRFDTVIAVDRTLTDPAAAQALRRFAEAGGNVVLTDDALAALPAMGLVPADAITVEDVYAGSVSFQPDASDGAENTYDDPLAAGVHPPGSAEGPRHRKQTTEPVPIGYAIQDEDGDDLSTMPQHGVTAAAFTDAGGRIVGVVGDSDAGNVTYGEIPVGEGQVRVLGSLLPFPTDEYDHPFGLNDYSITFTAYEMTRNLLSWDRDAGNSGPPAGPGTADGGTQTRGRTGTLAATGVEPLMPVAALLLVAAAGALRWRRVRPARR